MNERSIKTVDGFTLSVVSSETESTDVVVWLHGITESRDEYLGFFKDGAEWLARSGIASLRFDFRGHGKSSGSSLDFSVVGQNYDVRAVIEAAQVWYGPDIRIHLVGASFGAPPAIFGAIRFRFSVCSLFLIAPVLSYRRTFVEPETEWAAELFSKKRLADLDRTGQLFMNDTFCIGHQLIGEMEVIRPDRELEYVNQPVTIVHGDRDSMVPYKVTAEVCRQMRNVEFVTLSGADHGYMQYGDEEGQRQESVANKHQIFELLRKQIGQ